MRTHALWKVITHIARAAAADERLDPLAHLGGRLVREGDRQDLTGLDVPGRQEMGDPLGEDARLARPGTRHDEQGATLVEHRIPLLGVEPDEELLGVDCRSGTSRAPPPDPAPQRPPPPMSGPRRR